MARKKQTRLRCQHCGETKNSQGIRTHERWCSENPANRLTGAPPEKGDESYSDAVVPVPATIEDFFSSIVYHQQQIQEHSEAIARLKENLEEKLNELGLQHKPIVTQNT